MWPRVTGACLALLTAFAGAAGAAGAAGTQPPPLPAEHLVPAKLPAASPHWVWVFDESNNNETDMRLYLYDGDAHRELGQIDIGFWPGVAMSPDGRTTAVATTYFSRGSHGTRTDVLEFTDNSTLSITGEIVLPPKHAQTIPLHNVAYSADARLVYVTNLSPVTSYTVVDLSKKAVVGEVDTDGCVLVIPSGERRVSSLCVTGRMLTVSLDESGHETARKMSAPFFSVDKDPIFIQGVPTANGIMFLSFLGDVYGVDLSGAEPMFAPAWPTMTAAERGKWRPGGGQVLALHRKTGRIYLQVHQGGPGTHKVVGTEVWVFDSASHRRVARWPIDIKKYSGIQAIQVSQDDKPLLFLTTETSDLLILDAITGRVLHAEPKLGQSSWYLLNP
jgi:methylamine dehydrogenase heavy chain